jgi:hypothetical protein
MNGIIALLGALGSFFFFGFLFSEPSPSLALGFLFTGGFELLASFLDDFCRTK